MTVANRRSIPPPAATRRTWLRAQRHVADLIEKMVAVGGDEFAVCLRTAPVNDPFSCPTVPIR